MKNQPNIGDRKEVVRFAFLPILVESRLIWLKRYKLVKEYQMHVEWDEFYYEYYNMYNWQTVERKLMRK